MDVKPLVLYLQQTVVGEAVGVGAAAALCGAAKEIREKKYIFQQVRLLLFHILQICPQAYNLFQIVVKYHPHIM